jgi:imidazolonepropionase-like amidohydrolase
VAPRAWIAIGVVAVAVPAIAVVLGERIASAESSRNDARASGRDQGDLSIGLGFVAANDVVAANERADGASSSSARGGARAPRSSFVSALMSDGAIGTDAQDAHRASRLREPLNGERGSKKGLALLAKKALVVGPEGRDVVDDPIVLVKDGKIEAVRPSRESPAPEGYELVDCGDKWLVPGFIDLHCHIAGKSFLINDINDVVYMTNPELHVSAGVQPGNPNLMRGVAGGVTSVLFIPGSGSNMGGQGVLLKTGLDTYEEMLIRNPGSLKLAQAGNPERWAIGVGRSFMNWNTRNTFLRGLAYAKQWKAFEDGKGPKPERNIQWDVFRDLLEKKTQVSTHTQVYQVVEMTLTMVRQEFGLDVYIDHGEFAGMRAAKQAQELGVQAIIGPRELDGTIWQLSPGSDGKYIGIAAGYQQAGHKMIGFNTDSPIVPEEELPVQATVAVHYGFDNTHMDAVRGLTIVPAMTAGIDKRVGSFVPGKDADILVVTGDPIDPRNSVDTVFIEGRRVYDAARERRRW